MNELKFLRDNATTKLCKMTLSEAYGNRQVIRVTSDIAKERHPKGFNMEQLRACAPEAIKLLGITIVEEEGNEQ